MFDYHETRSFIREGHSHLVHALFAGNLVSNFLSLARRLVRNLLYFVTSERKVIPFVCSREVLLVIYFVNVMLRVLLLEHIINQTWCNFNVLCYVKVIILHQTHF